MEKKGLEILREKIGFYGSRSENVSIVDLLSILIGKEASDALNILSTKTPSELYYMTKADFAKLPGIGEKIAERLEAATAFSIKLANEHGREHYVIRCPEDAYKYPFLNNLKHEKQEHLAVLLLDTKNQVIHHGIVFKGSLNASIVHPREIFALAIERRCASVIVAHNHPSQNTTESTEDVEITQKLVKAGRYLGIEVLDHIIIGKGFNSLKEKRNELFNI